MTFVYFMSAAHYCLRSPHSCWVPERVRAFAQRRQISLPVAFDRDRKTMRAFGLSGFPNLVVIDRTGRVRLTHTGYNSSETRFRRDLTQLLQSL